MVNEELIACPIFGVIICYCNAQNILLYGNSAYQLDTMYEVAITVTGNSCRTVSDRTLTSDDFIGIDVLIDVVIVPTTQCPQYYMDSLSIIQNFLDSGGSAFYAMENSGFTPCYRYKVDNLINPYLAEPNVADQGISIHGCSLASTLPGYKNRILTTPNMIAGRSVPCNAGTSYGGVISDSILYIYNGGAIGGAVYLDDDVVVRSAKYVLWGDASAFVYQNIAATTPVLENLLDFLLSCNPTTECEGYECGIGFCGGDCPNNCDATEVCDGNTCTCPPGFSRFGGTCLDCPAIFGNCVGCTSSACTRCESNYHLESGRCVADTVFGSYENLSQYNFLEESTYFESDNFDPSTISMIDFLISPSSNNFKKADNKIRYRRLHIGFLMREFWIMYSI